MSSAMLPVLLVCNRRILIVDIEGNSVKRYVHFDVTLVTEIKQCVQR
jgi:hypothetical protein